MWPKDIRWLHFNGYVIEASKTSRKSSFEHTEQRPSRLEDRSDATSDLLGECKLATLESQGRAIAAMLALQLFHEENQA